MSDLIIREMALGVVGRRCGMCIQDILDIPSAEPEIDEWCTDCKEYDSERHCCPRFNHVIRTALKEANMNDSLDNLELAYMNHRDILTKATTLREWISEEMHYTRVTRVDICNSLEISETTLCNWKYQRSGVPKYIVVALCWVFDCLYLADEVFDKFAVKKHNSDKHRIIPKKGGYGWDGNPQQIGRRKWTTENGE